MSGLTCGEYTDPFNLIDTKQIFKATKIFKVKIKHIFKGKNLTLEKITPQSRTEMSDGEGFFLY